MSRTLLPSELGLDLNELIWDASSASDSMGWIGQHDAYEALKFGLTMNQPGSHVMVVGDSGSGRDSLVFEVVREFAARQPSAPDLVFLNNFEQPDAPLAFWVSSGQGHLLKAALLQVSQAEVENRLSAMRQVQALSSWFEEATQFETWCEHAITYLANSQAEVAMLQANLAVNHARAIGSPVLRDDDPTIQTLFGAIQPSEFLAASQRVRPGNILKAHGGFILLRVRDLLRDTALMEKVRRFLLNGQWQPQQSLDAKQGVVEVTSLHVDVKMVMIGSPEDYYDLEAVDSELILRFPVKVDFVESMIAASDQYRQSAYLIAKLAEERGLKAFEPKAMARLMVELHRWVEDQQRMSTNFGQLQSLMIESDHGCRARAGEHVSIDDVEKALSARRRRHDYSERRLHEAIAEGEILIRIVGREVGQINALTQIDLGDYQFGAPVRISARAFAGDEGVINIDREIEISDATHDKGLFILKSWLSATFVSMTPLCLSASLVFEQEYHGIEGDSATCAELFALISALAGLPLPQGVAVTGAMNQHGELLPVGGINDKIEGYFRVCQRVGLDGNQAVIIPSRNARHLLLDKEVVAAVAEGKFKVHVIDDVWQGLELLFGMPVGSPDEHGDFRPETLLGRVQKALENFRRACDATGHFRDKELY